ncbi:hypothetical protein [Geminocystis herdmanii]|uniref:hypothetical protein n=1 Tax=Geminocystis herdmanii TaxID=669359 RepID=UPI00034BF836|nr:hypothetical protein [Geminocystis herdmanii]
MSTITDNDLKELKDLINSKFEQVDRKFEKVFEELTSIKVDIATVKSDVNGLGKRLDETKEALSKRLDNLEFIARSVIGGILVALLLGLSKILYPNLLS